MIVLGPDIVGDADATARARLLAAHPNADRRAGRRAVHARTYRRARLQAPRTLCKPIAPATLVDEAIDMLRRQQAAPPVLVGHRRRGLRATALVLLAGVGTLVDVHQAAEALWSAVTQERPELCVLDERMAGGRAAPVRRCAATGRWRTPWSSS